MRKEIVLECNYCVMFSEVEEMLKKLEAYNYMESRKGTMYLRKSNRDIKGEIGDELYNELIGELRKVLDDIERDKKYLKLRENRHGVKKIYINTEKGFRVFGKKYSNQKNIIPYNIINHRKEFLDLLRFENIYSSKKMYFIKFDIKKYYLNIKFEHIQFGLEYFSKKKYGIVTKRITILIGNLLKIKRNGLKINNNKILNKKYRLLNIINKVLIIGKKIYNYNKIIVKLRKSLFGFYNYYKFAKNIKNVILDLIVFIKKSIRFIYKNKTGFNIFEINKILSNNKFLKLNILT